MIDELKLELEKTFNRKISDRGDCEALVQDIYEKTGAVLSYNTLRRLFGLAEFRKPRESTLDYLAKYCGFRSFNDFSQRYTDVDIWPTWENLYVSLAQNDVQDIIDMLKFRKARQEYFTISFTVCLRELLNRGDLISLQTLLREPSFQYDQLPYDEVAQIGVLVGLHFRDFYNEELEKTLLLEPNFRDIVFKIFVDYARLNQKYGAWITYLSTQNDLDKETKTFINALEVWRALLMLENPRIEVLRKLQSLSDQQHPILFGRIFGIKMLTSKSKKQQDKLIDTMALRLQKEPHFATELLYEPTVQSLVFRKPELLSFVYENNYRINDIKFWYHFSQVSIHRIFEASMLIQQKDFTKAKSILEHIPFGHIRHGYREFLELFVSFFRLNIAQGLGLPMLELENEFKAYRAKINYPIFNDDYFRNYFVDQTPL